MHQKAWRKVDGRTDEQPEAICPSNFFEVGGIINNNYNDIYCKRIGIVLHVINLKETFHCEELSLIRLVKGFHKSIRKKNNKQKTKKKKKKKKIHKFYGNKS